MAIIDELLDIVNERDEVIGQVWRAEIYAKNMRNFRVINAFLVNDKSQLWIPKRTATKRLCPNALDVSVGGHVSAGETYEQAFERELAEELNLHLKDVDYRCIGHLTPHEHNVSAFMKVYEIKSNTTPDYNRDDFSESQWITPAKLLKELESGIPAKSDLIKLVKLFYLKK